MAIEVDRLVTVLEAQYGPYLRDLNRAQQDTNRKLADIEKRFAQTNASVSRSVGSMGAALGTIGAYLSVDQIIAYANAWTRVTRSIDAGSDVFGISLKSAEELTDLANEARIDVEAYTKTFIRTAAAVRDYGMDANVAAEVTSTLAKALKLGSASASEQASTILQFSQALQKGKLDGDEFRTVMENAGVIQELLAKRLGVTKGKIVEMAADGKLKLLDLVGAMQDGKESIDAVFNMQPTTVDEAFTKLNNNIIRFVGEMDSAYGISKSLTGALDFLASNIDTVGKAALVAGIGLLAMFAPAIIGGMVALGAGAVVAGGSLGALFGVIGGGAAALSLFGDQVDIAADGLVSLKDVARATAEQLRLLTEEEQRLAAFTSGGFADAFGESFMDRVRRQSKEFALGRGFETTVSKERPTHKLEGPGADKDTEKRQKRFERKIAQANRQIDAAEAEGRAVGKSAFDVARLRKEQELLTAARENDIQLTPQVLADIDQTSLRYAKAVTGADATRAAYEDLANTSKAFLSDFVRGMKNGESASDALASGLDRISDKLIDMAVNNLVETALGGLTGRGGNSQAGGLAGGLMSLFGFADGGIAAHGKPVELPRFAKGGVSNSAAIFGEAGPEAAVPLPDGRRIPVDLRMPAPAVVGGGMTLNFAPNITLENGTLEGVQPAKSELIPLIQRVARNELSQAFDRNDAFRWLKGG